MVHRHSHISGWPSVLLAALVIPIVLLISLAQRLFGLKTTADLTPQDVEGYLHNFLDGRGGVWDWDDFTSIPITDPSLDAVREKALTVELPATEDGLAELRRLLEEVRAM